MLTRLANERTLCAFDFDGTLAPIVGHPDQARMRARTRYLLSRLAEMYPCVILSGRARADVLGKLGGVRVERVIGSHGAEAEGTSGRTRRQVRRWNVALDRELGLVPGLWVEDKGMSLTVHYRQVPQKAEARRRILQAARNLKGARIFGGKQVVNVVAEGDPNKGIALAAERDRLKCGWVLFVGDDENDEDAFVMDGNVVPVRVGRKPRSHARYYLRTQVEIDKLLEQMVMLRECAKPPVEGDREIGDRHRSVSY